MNDREPTAADLQAIEEEFNSALLTYPLETDKDKTIDDWGDLIIHYVCLAVDARTPDEQHERFVQAGNLSARAARAVRTGEHK